MNNKFAVIVRCELKKLASFMVFIAVAFILWSGIHSGIVADEVNDILFLRNDISIKLYIIDPYFSIIEILPVLLLAYIQFGDGFNKLWKSLPVANGFVVRAKLITGISLILICYICMLAVMLFTLSRYGDIYRDALMSLNITPDIISAGEIFKNVLSLFAVTVFIYLLSVIMSYVMGSSLTGAVITAVMIFIPFLAATCFESISREAIEKIMPFIYPGYFNVYLSIYSGSTGALNDMYMSLFVYGGVLGQYPVAALVYYSVLSAGLFALALKLSAMPKLSEQSGAFSLKNTSFAFKLLFVLCFALAGYSMHAPFAVNIVMTFILAAVGFAISTFIVKKQGVRV